MNPIYGDRFSLIDCAEQRKLMGMDNNNSNYYMSLMSYEYNSDPKAMKNVVEINNKEGEICYLQEGSWNQTGLRQHEF